MKCETDVLEVVERIVEFLNPKRVAISVYLMYGLAGISFVLFPSSAVSTAANFWNMVLWHVFLLLGSAIAIVGNLRRNAYIEVSGMPLLVSAFVVYVSILVGSLFVDAGSTVNARIGFAFILFGGAIGIVGRTAELVRVILVGVRLREREDGDGSKGGR